MNLNSLNPQQRLAVETIRGPVLILAGAGTGKTRVITFRIAHLAAQGVPPANILAVTFTNKAAREMKERVSELLPKARSADPQSRITDHASRPTVCTFHSLCVRILRRHIERLGYKKNFVIYDESEQLSAIKKILSHISDKSTKVDPAAVLGLLSRFKNGGERAAAFAEPNVAALAEHVRKRYESALHACNAVDFDDLILLTLRLFKEHPDVLEACRAQYRYVMVDEYQDTNASQFALVHALTKEHRNLCVVGDDDQSIYAWRGAEVANLLDLEKHFPEVKVVKLEQNYRSTTRILQAANAVIKHNVRRRGKQLWSQNGDGSLIQLQTFETDEEEARTVAEQIEFNRLAHRLPWADHAVLFRTNQQSRPLETELRKAGVRYHLVGGQSYFDRREIRDVIAYLKTFVNPHDDVSLLRIANVPARGLSDVTMERLLAASQERHCSVFTAMKHTDVLASLQARTRDAITDFTQLVERQRAWLEGTQQPVAPGAPASGPAEMRSMSERAGSETGAPSLAIWAKQLIGETGYVEELRRSEKNRETAESRVRNVQDFIADLANANEGGTPQERLMNFLEELMLDSDREEENKEAGDAVTLITMHSCKGLEFPHVFIVGIEDGLLPHSRSKVEGTLDEERRLFYVALTRAMKTLSLSHCNGRKKYGQVLPCHPSPFLKELPPDLVERADERAKQPVTKDQAKDFFAAMRTAAG